MADDPTIQAINWIEPRRRGIIPLEGFHVPRSLARAIRRGGFEIRIDHGFEAVIRACAEPTSARPRTWLNETLIGLYVELARDGFAHSVEVWRDGELAAVSMGWPLGGAFFGEACSRGPDSSKIALVDLVARLRAGGFMLLDAQFLTAHLERFGAVEINRTAYLRRLRLALEQAGFPVGDYPLPDGATSPFPGGGGGGGGSASSGSAHSISQTS